jgi:hypothetical protein
MQLSFTMFSVLTVISETFSFFTIYAPTMAEAAFNFNLHRVNVLFLLNQNEKIESINVLNSFILNMKKVSLQRLHKKKELKKS